MKNKLILILVSIIVAQAIWLAIEIPDDYETKVNIDSTVTTVIDSIPPPDTVYVDTLEIPVPTSIEVTDSTEEDNKYSYLRNYTTTHTDTLLDATIRSTVQGFLISQTLEYTPNYPLQINTRIENRIVKEIIRTPKPKPYVSVGLDVGGNRNGFTLAQPSVWYTKPNGNSFGVGYDIIDKAPTIGIRYNLRNLFK